VRKKKELNPINNRKIVTIMKKIMLFFLIIYFNSIASAQYLEVRRSATVKEDPIGRASIIEKVQKGDFLELLNDGVQKNGYYKVNLKTDYKEGWIYRTLVRRFTGNIPFNNEGPQSSLTYEPIPESYYAGIENLTGDDLKKALNEIIKEHHEFPYGEIWDILKETDIDPEKSSNVIGIYSGFSMDSDREYDGGKGWNREHVWAKSRGDFGTRIGAGTDLHHLRAADVSTNSARNNRSFDECDIQYIDESGKYKGTTQSFKGNAIWTWEPRNSVKGDVARMLFYMAVRYEGEDDEPDLELVDTILVKSSKEPMHGKLSTLIKWHKEDPVDNYERYRNYIIYKKYQRNRNPFIDHPTFVEKIWGN
jgi:endonuclease I